MSLVVAALAAACCSLRGVVDGPSGTAIRGAAITIDGHERARTDASGHFAVHVDPGVHRLVASATGFAPATIDRLEVGDLVSLEVTLETVGAGTLRTVGEIRVDGALARDRSTIPERYLTREALEDAGTSRLIEALGTLSSATVPRPDGGAPSAVGLAALRGPDPSETLIALDGQVLNDSFSGSLDLSQFPISPFRGVEVVEGLGPEDATGANTIGGEINLESLAPTREPHGLIALTTDSEGTSSGIVNATGMTGHLGFAAAFGNVAGDGPVHEHRETFLASTAAPVVREVGSGVTTRTTLTNLTWDFSPRASLRVRTFGLVSSRDESAALAGLLPNGTLTGPGPARVDQGLHALRATSLMPLGAGSIEATFASSVATRAYDGGPTTSPYETSLVDHLATTSVAWAHTTATGEVALGTSLRDQSLSVANLIEDTQHERLLVAYVRAARDVGGRTRLAAAVSSSEASTFGSSLDGRIGATVELDRRSDVRASIGTGFRAPLLAERFETPLATLRAELPASVDAHCVAQNGNRREDVEHVTEYELAYARRLDRATVADLDLYRTNLRGPIEIAYPLEASCPGEIAGSAVVGEARPINVGRAIYRGATLRIVRHTGNFLTSIDYGVDSAFPLDLPASVANPTSGANLVSGHQFQGVPVHVETFAVQLRERHFHAALHATYRGRNNELNVPPYVRVDTAIGRRFGAADYAIGVANLTGVARGPFTRIGAGVPYPGLEGDLPTDRYALAPTTMTFSVTLRR